ncbi:MAG: branched-chain-amino-acid transaminase [Armatimonadetes bacterium]|nr:branched-chain-amino-acid transaminase [Armatimonadota bacterium]
MPKLVWLNGNVMPLETAVTSVGDHAHLYGDGLFEGIRIYNRRIFKLDEHLERLFHGMAHLRYENTMSLETMRETILDVCRQADISEGYIRLNVSRGTGLGLDPKNIDRRPNIMIMVSSLNLYPPEAYDRGLDVVTCSIRTIPSDSLDPRLKCIGKYAGNILAKAEANSKGAGEGLMLNHQGQLAECTGDNIFLVIKGVLCTPHRSSGLLQGITRDTVIELARAEGMEVREEILTPFDVYTASEAFLTGTAAEVIAMISLDGTPIGDGRPGPVTRQLMELYRELTKTGMRFDSLETCGNPSGS